MNSGAPVPDTSGCSCISGCGASPNPGGRRSAPSGRPGRLARDGARLGAGAEGLGDAKGHCPEYGGGEGTWLGVAARPTIQDQGEGYWRWSGGFGYKGGARIAGRDALEMTLLHLMHDVPLWVTAVLLTAGAAIYSIGLMLLTRTAYGVDRLKLNNEVAGFKFAVIGVFYAVMLAFVVIAVWEDFRKTEDAVRDEAKAVIDLAPASPLPFRSRPAPKSEIISSPIPTTCAKMNGRPWPWASRATSSSRISIGSARRSSPSVRKTGRNSPSIRTRSGCWR